MLHVLISYHQGDDISNSFDNVGAVNGGFAQGNGTFNIANNGAYGGNTLSISNDKRADTSYGGTGGSFNGAGSQVVNVRFPSLPLYVPAQLSSM